MAINTTACYYGRHFGCVNVLMDPDCRLCAERLTHAVNQAVHRTTASASEAPVLRLDHAVRIPRHYVQSDGKQVQVRSSFNSEERRGAKG
jgi:hypothetical protein